MTKSRSKKAEPPKATARADGVFTFDPKEEITAYDLATIIRCILLKGTITVPSEDIEERPWTVIGKHFKPFKTN